MEYCVYKHTSPKGMVYIGMTRQSPLKRWGNGKGYGHNERFTSDIIKYGWDNFSHEILLSGLSEEEAIEKEKEFIAKFKSNIPTYGYNMTGGGECYTEEMARKQSKTKKGILFTEDHKKALSKAKKGVKWSDAQRVAIIPALRRGAEHPMARPVSRYTLDGEYIDTMPYARMYCEILKNKNAYKHICSVCQGKRITAYGYIWKYEG